MHWTFIFGRPSTLRFPLCLTGLKAVSPGPSISPHSEGKWQSPYCVSKFALVGLSDALRAELASENISVKGRYRKEFAWFSLGASSSLVSMDADRAAGQILEAVRNRRPELTITFAARLASIAQALVPNLTAELLKLTPACYLECQFNPKTRPTPIGKADRLSPISLLIFKPRPVSLLSESRRDKDARSLTGGRDAEDCN
jgi:hypothetical protein